MLLSFWSISIAGSSTQPQPSCFVFLHIDSKLSLSFWFPAFYFQTTPCVHPPPCPGLHHLQLGLWAASQHLLLLFFHLPPRFPAPHVTKETPLGTSWAAEVPAVSTSLSQMLIHQSLPVRTLSLSKQPSQHCLNSAT